MDMIKYLDADEAAQVLRLSAAAVRQACRTNEIPSITVGRRYRIPVWWLYEKAGMPAPKQYFPVDQQMWLF